LFRDLRFSRPYLQCLCRHAWHVFWIAYHGFSININNDLKKYDAIIPCGIKEISLESENNNKFVPKKLDNPVRKKPNPPKLTVIAQNTLLKRLDPVK